MEPNYIQLPPLPSDMPIDLIEIIWGFARMGEPERKKFLDFMRENMKHGADNGKREELLRMMEKSGGEASPYVEEFNSLMHDLTGRWLHRHVKWRRLFSSITALMKNP